MNMRVLILPYFYQSRDAAACSTITEAASWVKRWLKRDDDIHVYWVMPPDDVAEWEPSLIAADSDRVTPIESRLFMQGKALSILEGWREDTFHSIQDEIGENHAYFDVVINQQPFSNFIAYQALHEMFGPTYSRGRPFMWTKHVHDFYAPGVVRELGRYPNRAWGYEELTSLIYSDRVWSDSQADTDHMVDWARSVFKPTELKGLQDRMEVIGVPIDTDKKARSYRDSPKYLHVAGDDDKDKRTDIGFEVGKALYSRFGIETIRTSMRSIRSEYENASWATCYPQASYNEYHKALSKGDLCIVSSEHEGGGLTYFEQGASGQVMVYFDKGTGWKHDQTPEDYPLFADSVDGVKKLAFWVVKNWKKAVDIHSDMMDTVEERWSSDAIGDTTYESLTEMHDERLDTYSLTSFDEDVIRPAMEDLGEGEHTLSEINRATAEYTKKGDPMLDLFSYTLSDMVLALKVMGYEDKGGREPRFA